MQILHNLLGNAVKFTDDGEIVLDLDCSAPDRIVLEVRDTGVGMEAAELSQVLEAFTQGRVGSLPRNGGSGLGLAIVRQLAQLMQGEVTLSSAPGQGLTARVDVAMPVARGAVAPADKRNLPKVPPLRILAAEDNATNRIILGSLLDALGLQARIVASGDEAVALWRAETFDVLLFDIAMPGRDGMATLATLIEEGALRGRPVPPAVAVTANAMLHQVEAYLARGFVACVPKPISLEGLATALIASQAGSGPDRPGG
jgi:CheY-like chemotaxis protein